MCAPATPEMVAKWRKMQRIAAEKNRTIAQHKAEMDKINNAVIFGTANVAKLDVSFATRSYEQRFLQMVQRRRELVRV